MSQIQYATIIFPDHVYEEIQLLQKELSHKDDKILDISDTIKILLRFCLGDLVDSQIDSFLREYMCKKETFLENFTTSVFMSTRVIDYDSQ
jgi:hypothetical protein